TYLPDLARLLVVNGEGRLLRRDGEATLDALGHARHQCPVAEVLPALLRLVNRDDRPTLGRRPGCVEDLPFRQAAVARMDRRDRCLVLLLGRARELVYDAVRHGVLLSCEATPRGDR